MYSERADRPHVRAPRRAAAVVASGALVGVGLLFWACGGTTGHDGQTTGASVTGDAASDATLADGGDADATVYDTGAFDVDIMYADRMLAEAAPQRDGGAGGADGSGFPLCPGWEQVDDKGNAIIDGYGNVVDGSINGVPIDPSTAVAFIPTDFTADGGIGPAVAGGACAEQRWYPDVDLSCMLPDYVQNSGPPSIAPCSWAIGLPNAVSGPMGGQSRYDLCKAVYDCVESTKCVTSGKAIAARCLCGSNINDCTAGANGPCAQQILSAFELPDLSPPNIKIMLANFATIGDLSKVDSSNGLVAPTYVQPIFEFYDEVIAKPCFADAGGPSSDAGTH